MSSGAQVFAGAVAASAISFVLLTAGAAIRLSPALAGSAASRTAKQPLAGGILGTPAVPILAAFSSADISRGACAVHWDSANTDEVQFRDGILRTSRMGGEHRDRRHYRVYGGRDRGSGRY